MTADIQEALNLQSQGKFEQAEKIYLEFLVQNHKQPDVSNLLGLIYAQTNQPDKALKYFEYAVEGFPCAEYYQNFGCFYMRKKTLKKLWTAFQKQYLMSLRILIL